jgi:hypothetical protein
MRMVVWGNNAKVVRRNKCEEEEPQRVASHVAHVTLVINSRDSFLPYCFTVLRAICSTLSNIATLAKIKVTW